MQVSHWKENFISQARQSIFLSLPIILSELTGSLSAFIGTLMVARLGHEALAASALVTTTYATVMATCWGVILSIGVMVAHAYGAQQKEDVKEIVGQGFWLAVLLSLPMMVLLKNAPRCFLFFKQNPQNVALAKTYFDPLIWSILPGLWAGVLQQFVIALKRSHVIMACTVTTVIVSVIFSYLLIFGKLGFPALGLAGIGWATTITHLFMLLFMASYVVIVKTCRDYHVFSRIWRSNIKRLRELFSIGWPVGLMFGIEVCGLLIAVVFCGWIGSNALAAYQIAMQCMLTSIMAPWGMAQGTTILVGHAKGAKNFMQARYAGYVGMLLALGMMLLVACIYWLAPQAVVFLFIDIHDAKNLPLIALTISMLHVMAWVQIFDGVRMIASGALRGLKDTRVSLLISIVSFWLLGLPAGFWLAFLRHWGAVGIWYGDLLGVIVGSIILIIRFSREASCKPHHS